jgi:hypothetical protein
MTFIFKKSTFAIYLLACCSGIYITKAMEQPMVEIEKKREEPVSAFENLSPDLKTYIISFLGSATDIKEAVKNIKALSIASKEFHNLINDHRILGSLIREINNRFGKTTLDIAMAFKNRGALNWFKEYAQNNPRAKEIRDKYLLKAIEAGGSLLTQFLLHAGADVNHLDNEGCTPLHRAADRGYKDIVALLLAYGADINKTDNYGNTPLSWAAFNYYEDTLEFLLEHGTDINKVSNDGRTPFDLAITNDNKEIVELLLNAEAEVNKANNNDNTPL